MAEFLEKVNYSTMSMPKAMNRTNPAPLDASAVWTSLEDLKNYAQTNAVAYVGQILSLVEYNAETAEISKVKAYIIKDKAGNVEEVGSATLGDNKSIELNNGVLSIKDFGKRYYKYVAAVEGGEAAHYEVTEGWIAGLEPKVVLEGEDLIIGWYEPNPTTAEGVKDQVVEVQGEVEQAKEYINSLDEILNGTDENPGGLVGEVEDIADVLYGTEGENPVPGLIADVEAIEKDLEDNYYTKSETYSKSEVDGLVSGVFHFEGTAESYEALPAEGNTKGDVYQVADKEYAWDGNTWVELGYVVDLSGYYTKEETNAEIKKVQDALDLAEEDIADNAEAIEALQQADVTIGQRIDGVVEDLSELTAEDERLVGLIGGHDTRIETLETAKTGFDTHFTTVDGQIKALQDADTTLGDRLTAVEGFETRIGTLEGYVGTPTGNLGALYPAVESLNQRLNDIVAEGGEPNQLNGISISGTLVPVNDGLIAELPIFIGSTAGLVPVASDSLTVNHVLNAKGNWVNPFGDLGEKTVKEYVDQKVEEVIIEWSAI